MMKKYLFILCLIHGSLNASVIPHPQSYQVGKNATTSQLEISGQQHPLVLKKLATLPAIKITDHGKLNFKIHIKKALNTYPVFRMNESYELKVDGNTVTLASENEYGSLHGLETMRQLLADFDGKLPKLEVRDHPRFPWRGLLIDVARSWITLETLKKQIDLMATVKLNILHLHLSDDQSFRLESKSYPKLHLKNPDKHFYSQKEMLELIAYGFDRGIRIIPEFDVPGHVSAMVAAYPHLASKKELSKASSEFGPQDAALNPINEETYLFLENLFKEMAAIFPDPYFHVGGDEVSGKHWAANSEIVQYMKKNNLKDMVELQFVFTKRIEGLIKGLGKKMMVWDEALKEGKDLDAVIQIWRGPKHAREALRRKSPIIFSYGFYLDLQLPSESHYNIDPARESGLTQDSANLWGGEACLWSERVTDQTITNRIWPRAMAVAERLWSAKTTTDVRDFYDRQIGLGRTFKIYESLIVEKILLDAPSLKLDQQTLGEFFSWLEPGKFYSQHRYRKWNTNTAQDQWVDFLPTESLKATMLNWVFEDWLKNKNPKDLKILEDTFSSWLTLSESLVLKEGDLAGLAKDLAGLSRVAKESLGHLVSHERPGQLWFLENRTRLGMMGQVRAGMQPAMHSLVERMVHLVAQKHSLSYR